MRLKLEILQIKHRETTTSFLLYSSDSSCWRLNIILHASCDISDGRDRTYEQWENCRNIVVFCIIHLSSHILSNLWNVQQTRANEEINFFLLNWWGLWFCGHPWYGGDITTTTAEIWDNIGCGLVVENIIQISNSRW